MNLISALTVIAEIFFLAITFIVGMAVVEFVACLMCLFVDWFVLKFDETKERWDEWGTDWQWKK